MSLNYNDSLAYVAAEESIEKNVGPNLITREHYINPKYKKRLFFL